MPTELQESLECKICYEKFNEYEHRPLTLVCDGGACGHTFCAQCVAELRRSPASIGIGGGAECPACKAPCRFATPNWFALDLIRHSAPRQHADEIAQLDLLSEQVDIVKAHLSKVNKLLIRQLSESSDHTQSVRQKIELKVNFET